MSQAEIKTKLSADGSELTRALQQGISKASDFKTQMRGIGASIGAAFTASTVIQFVRHLAEVSDQIQDSAGALQISTDELQAFDAAARKTAGGVDGFRAAMKKLAEVQADAREKGGAAADTFDKLGMGAAGYTASLAEVLKATADYYARTGDLATVQDLLGRSAVTTREALDEIAQQSLPGFIESMKDAGLVIESEGIKKMAEFNLMLEEGKVKMSGWGVNFVRNMSDAVKGWNMIRKAWLDGTGMGLNDMTPEELEKFMGLGDRAKLKTTAGTGSIQDRVAAEAERRTSKALKDAELAERKQLEVISATQESGASMMGFLAAVKAGEAEMISSGAERAKQEAASMFDFIMALGDAPGGLAQEQSNRFSDLRRIGANELGRGIPAGKQEDRQAQMVDLLKKLVTETGKTPEAVKSLFAALGVFI